MKLKLIAAVVGLALSAASQAQIVPPTTTGGSDLLLDVWEQGASNGAPDQSFTLNLGETMSQFLASDASSSTLATVLSTDSTWTSFLSSSSATAGDLQWSVVASGSKVPTRSSYLASVTAGEDPVGFGATNANVNSANTTLNEVIANMNVAATPNEQVNVKGSAAYYQTNNLSNISSNSWDNGNNLGATGVQIAQALNVGGVVSTTANTTVLPGVLGFVQNATTGNYVLSYSVAAVPEAPGFGMVLAGLVALGFVALRRKNA